MTISDAVATVAQMVRDTGKTATESVAEMWDELVPFSHEDAQTLMRESLASRVGSVLRGTSRAADDTETLTTLPSGAVRVAVAPYKGRAMERHEVTCQILQDVVYHVNGVAKSMATFTRYDALTKLDSVRHVEAGVTRHRKMWEYVVERLTKFRKMSVGDLSEGEQMGIARMVHDLRNGRETPSLAELT